jgi:hypothetical protein
VQAEAETESHAEGAAPRRGSTVRERAGFGMEGAPSPTLPPPAAPVISSSSAEDAAPKRGWWAKRLSGDKS